MGLSTSTKHFHLVLDVPSRPEPSSQATANDNVTITFFSSSENF